MSSLVPNFDKSLPTTCPIDLGTSPDGEALRWGKSPLQEMIARKKERDARARAAEQLSADRLGRMPGMQEPTWGRVESSAQAEFFLRRFGCAQFRCSLTRVFDHTNPLEDHIRNSIWWLVYELSGLSFRNIGDIYGFDLTTIHHGCMRAQLRMSHCAAGEASMMSLRRRAEEALLARGWRAPE